MSVSQIKFKMVSFGNKLKRYPFFWEVVIQLSFKNNSQDYCYTLCLRSLAQHIILILLTNSRPKYRSGRKIGEVISIEF